MSALLICLIRRQHSIVICLCEWLLGGRMHWQRFERESTFEATMKLCYFILVLMSASRVEGVNVTISIRTTGYVGPGELTNRFYIGEPVTITCTSTGYTTLRKLSLQNTTVKPQAACTISNLGEIGKITTLASNLNLSTDISCNAAGNSYTLTVQGIVNKRMEKANLACMAEGELEGNSSTAAQAIPKLSVAPRDLTINAPSYILKGKEFQFSCTSVGGVPPSRYYYEILQGGVTTGSGSPYTIPKSASNENITLKCRDQTHSNWRITSDITVVKDVQLHYLSLKAKREITLNCKEKTTLKCNVGGWPVMYSWSCDDCGMDDTTDVLMVPKKTSGCLDGMEEEINCTAMVEGLTPLIITWRLIWYEHNIPAPSVSPQPTTNKSAVALGVILTLVLVAVIGGVVGYFLWKKKFRQHLPADEEHHHADDAPLVSGHANPTYNHERIAAHAKEKPPVPAEPIRNSQVSIEEQAYEEPVKAETKTEERPESTYASPDRTTVTEGDEDYVDMLPTIDRDSQRYSVEPKPSYEDNQETYENCQN